MKIYLIFIYIILGISAFAQVEQSTQAEKDSLLLNEHIQDSILKAETQLLIDEQNQINETIELQKKQEEEEKRQEEDSTKIPTSVLPDSVLNKMDSEELKIYYEILKKDSILKVEQKQHEINLIKEKEEIENMAAEDSIRIEQQKTIEELDNQKRLEEEEKMKMEEEERAKVREKEKELEKIEREKQRKEEEKELEKKRAAKKERNKKN